MWGKEVSATLVRKEAKKRKKKYLCVCECKQWRRGDLGGLRGKARWWGLCVERQGFEDLARGVKKVSVTLVRKGTKKKKKKNITCVPANGAMVVVGVGAKGRM